MTPVAGHAKSKKAVTCEKEALGVSMVGNRLEENDNEGEDSQAMWPLFS